MLKKLLKSRVFIILTTVLAVMILRHVINSGRAFYVPEYKFEEVRVTDSGTRIFKLCGLSPKASEEMIESGNFETVKKLNRLYFENKSINKKYILFPITAEEKITGEPTPLAPLKKGDILVTFNTHTADWRHGHIALVTDSGGKIILEHMAIGQTSVLSYAKNWGSYPAFAVMRYPDEDVAKKAADYAMENLIDVPYSIFAGLKQKDKSSMDKIDSSHCSHIVWQAYKAAGLDLDSNGGAIVTPHDVAMSPKLKTVQIFGMNPKDYESRLLK